MKSIINFLLLILFCSISSLSFAQPVDINTAKNVATNHLQSISGQPLKSTIGPGATINFTSVIPEVYNNDTLFYILNDSNNKSFVIVSADQRAWPILAYSTQGSFNEDEQPKAFSYWMDNRKKEIEYIINNDIQPNDATIAAWNNLILKSSVIETTSVEPLIKTQWGQECNYNAMCPTDAAGPCGHAVVGCTGTAMAQIMKYWNFPTKGIGSHSYYHPSYGDISADFGSTTYQWDQMSDNVTSQNDAVATLMYHCGVSLEMDFGPNASAAWDPRDELVQYFSYSDNLRIVRRAGISTSDWIKLLKSDLDIGHPIYYHGSDGNLIGHSFICDGYQGDEYFHFNWGWNGSSDGYFYLGDLSPDWYSYNDNHLAILNIVPGDLPHGYKGFFLSSNIFDVATKGDTSSVDVCSSSNWIASSNQPWLTLSTNTGGSGKNTITLTATENQSENDRSATVTISATGYSDQIITITQRTAVNVTPNDLYNSISQNAVWIQKLTLTGSIDARDFRTMRDSMPALTEIDLSKVNIIAYTGTEGPVTYNNRVYPANTIPDNAFFKDSELGNVILKKIILPETTTSIAPLAFGNCKHLSTIDIPASVTNIGDRTFESCNALINVDINNSTFSSIDGVLLNKEQSELIHCPISKTGVYTIPSSIANIKKFAFKNCIGLTNVIIPSSVTTIGDFVFQYCDNITSITIPSSVRSMDRAFYLCPALINVNPDNSNYSSIDGILFNKDQTDLIHYPTSKTGSYTVPSSVNSVKANAFSYCIGLTDIIIPPTVISIGTNAFSSCYRLTNISIPSSVNSIGYGTFINCLKLKTVTIPSSVISIGSFAFSECEKLDSIVIHAIDPIDLALSENVFHLVNKDSCGLYVPYGSKAAYGRANGWEEFDNIVEMPGVFLSNNKVGLGSKASTASIVISSGLNWNATSDKEWLNMNPSSGTIGRDTIEFTATELSTPSNRTATVTISAPGIDSQEITVTQYGVVQVSAGNLGAVLAEQLSNITSLSLTGVIDARDFKTMRDDMPALTDIDLSSVTIAEYSGTEGTEGITNYYYRPNAIPQKAFCDGIVGKTSLKSIILPNSVTSIEYMAFKNCVGLSTLNIPPQTTKVKHFAFSDCSGLTSVTIPASLISIDNTSFYMCGTCFNVDINNPNYSSIDGVFFNKSQTELLQFPAIKTGSYTIPSSVTTIGNYAFHYSSLSNVSIPSSVITIGEYSFDYSNLIKVSIPPSVTSIGNSAFCSCLDLATVTIPSSMMAIGDLAFGACEKLNSIYAYPASPVKLDSSHFVFANVDKYYCTLYVQDGSKAAYSEADQWKDFVNIVELANQAPVANAGPDLTVDENSIFSLDATTSYDPEGAKLTYLWNIPNEFTINSNNDSIPTFTAPEVPNDTTFTFSLVVNDGTNDSPADSIIVTVLNTIKSGIYEVNNTNKYLIYPNPTTGLLKILMEDLQERHYTIEVYNGIGEFKLLNENVSQIDLSSFSDGIYFIKLNINSQSYVQKIIKR